MKNILLHLRKYIKETILGPTFKLFEACLELLVPLIVAYIVDNGINNEKGINKDLIIYSCLVMIGIAFLGFAFSITAQYFSAKAAVGASTSLRSSLYKKIQSLSYSELDKMGTSTLITRMTSDVNQVQTGINLTLRLFLRSPIIVFGALIMAFTISPRLALIFIVVIILLLFIVLGVMFICIPLYKKVQNKLDSVTLSTRENLVGARVIRAFTREEDEIKSYHKKNKELKETQKKVGLISGLMDPLTYIIVNFGIIILVYLGAIKVNVGDLSQGDIIALYNYMSIILVELVKLAKLIITMNKAIACSNRIEQVMKLESSLIHKENDISSHYYIEYNNVSLKYHKDSLNSLSNISFSVNKGDTIGIIGGTGSGKTSLINLLCHFYDATNGFVSLNGKNVNSYNDEELREKIGIVPQKAVLFHGTIKSNLLWGNKNASMEDLNEALEISQSIDFVKNKEKGIDSVVEQNGANFSGGQKQRLCIARALVRKPEILILDDSTSALDYATDARLRLALKSLSYKPTIFIISQRTSSLQNADKIIVLDEGKVVGIGTHDELLNNCEEYQEIHYSQNKKEDL
ncbi:MAG: ABC transporter ATP-binding protein [Bacillales bacterium]|nr:ABC transporter ATP-binding protein [Bacillales bacterium]